jgi:folate-dependent phosphoribosylglycinamide formyltransferase PurN
VAAVFFGRRVHEAVLANGDTESGATVHWLSGDYDSGPIIAQVRVPVAAAETPETLEHKVKAVERQLLIDTLRSLSISRCARASPHNTQKPKGSHSHAHLDTAQLFERHERSP